MLPQIILKAGFSKPFWAGNPLVYPKAIDKAPALKLGDWVCVYDAKKIPIAYGFYNPHSLYRVRLIAWASEGDFASHKTQALKQRVKAAIALRQALHLPNPSTNCYRLMNSEGDKISGLTVDVLGDYIVTHVTAYWTLQEKNVLHNLLREEFPDKKIIWRFNQKSLQQEGYTLDKNTLEANATTHDEKNIIIKENDIQYVISPHSGQKTGFYCDQRETRALIRELAHDKDVLDLCCFNGGFALNAAKGGAHSVKGIDTSEPAVNFAKENAKVNGFNRIIFEEQDALTALAQTPKMDLIILDPPKLAPSHKHLSAAKRKYLQLNTAAMNALAPGGFLLTCSCSQAVSLDDFTRLLLEASLSCQKHIQILKTGGAGPDHPQLLAFPEGAYLKWVLLRWIV